MDSDLVEAPDEEGAFGLVVGECERFLVGRSSMNLVAELVEKVGPGGLTLPSPAERRVARSTESATTSESQKGKLWGVLVITSDNQDWII
ncbi:hypothetical protein GCM10029992_56760 [Glycomyces albus]